MAINYDDYLFLKSIPEEELSPAERNEIEYWDTLAKQTLEGRDGIEELSRGFLSGASAKVLDPLIQDKRQRELLDRGMSSTAYTVGDVGGRIAGDAAAGALGALAGGSLGTLIAPGAGTVLGAKIGAPLGVGAAELLREYMSVKPEGQKDYKYGPALAMLGPEMIALKRGKSAASAVAAELDMPDKFVAKPDRHPLKDLKDSDIDWDEVELSRPKDSEGLFPLDDNKQELVNRYARFMRRTTDVNDMDNYVRKVKRDLPELFPKGQEWTDSDVIKMIDLHAGDAAKLGDALREGTKGGAHSRRTSDLFRTTRRGDAATPFDREPTVIEGEQLPPWVVYNHLPDQVDTYGRVRNITKGAGKDGRDVLTSMSYDDYLDLTTNKFDKPKLKLERDLTGEGELGFLRKPLEVPEDYLMKHNPKESYLLEAYPRKEGRVLVDPLDEIFEGNAPMGGRHDLENVVEELSAEDVAKYGAGKGASGAIGSIISDKDLLKSAVDPIAKAREDAAIAWIRANLYEEGDE